jgi:hypothetical protein
VGRTRARPSQRDEFRLRFERMHWDLFAPASEQNIREELRRMARADLRALADMHILFMDDADPAVVEAFHRRRQIAREIVRDASADS